MYIPIFVLSLVICEAPVGKTVCEEETLYYRFARALDCWEARAIMIRYYDSYQNIIVNRAETTCRVEIESIGDYGLGGSSTKFYEDPDEAKREEQEALVKANIVPEPPRRR